MDKLRNWLTEIIETYWNVNDASVIASMSLTSEIIERYWNVNLVGSDDKYRASLEIIETYWNVNSDCLCCLCISCYRNNRNILECKLILSNGVSNKHNRNNRNILECKWKFAEQNWRWIQEIIETYWNVN